MQPHPTDIDDGRPYTPLPDGLAELGPGPSLGAALEALDPVGFNGFQLVVLLDAYNRQINHLTGRMLDVVHELAHAPRGDAESPPRRHPAPDPFASAEIAFGLTWTDYTADIAIAAARTSHERAPALQDAMLSGDLDLPKLKMISHELAEVPDDHVPAIIDKLLPEVGRCTIGQLRRTLRRLVVSVDPAAAQQRYDQAVSKRSVEHTEYANGTAAISGLYLPVDRAAAAWEHVDAIAHATQAAGTGDGRGIDQIRADVFADLLTGTGPTGTSGTATTGRAGAVTLHIDLTTLIYLDEHPGSIDGFGPVLADVARQTAAQLVDTAQWNFAVEQHGQTLAQGRLRYRPTTNQRRWVQTRDGTCRAPGCRRPAARCDLDHIRDWAKGGVTTVANLTSLCRRHHRAKHRGGFFLQRVAAGLEWRTPRGHTYTVLPERARAPRGPESRRLRR